MDILETNQFALQAIAEWPELLKIFIQLVEDAQDTRTPKVFFELVLHKILDVIQKGTLSLSGECNA